MKITFFYFRTFLVSFTRLTWLERCHMEPTTHSCFWTSANGSPMLISASIILMNVLLGIQGEEINITVWYIYPVCTIQSQNVILTFMAYDVVPTLWTLYRRWNNVVCVQMINYFYCFKLYSVCSETHAIFLVKQVGWILQQIKFKGQL